MIIKRSFIVVLLVASAGIPASAGRRTPWPVTVDPVGRVAWGSIGSTRNSPDTISKLGCSVHYDAVNRKNNVNCAAVDASSRSGQCATQQPELVQIALGIKGDSFLQFNWDASGTCTDIWVNNSSDMEPKQP
jgi:hypothetical protein